MKWNKRDPKRWHLRFAIRPRRIGERWIWLERYAYRRIDNPNKLSEITDPTYILSLSLSFYFYSFWREYTLPDGFTRWREQSTMLGSFAPPSITWHKPKVKLKVVA